MGVLPAGTHLVPSRPEWDRLPLPAVRGRRLMPSFLPEPTPAQDPSREGSVRKAVCSQSPSRGRVGRGPERPGGAHGAGGADRRGQGSAEPGLRSPRPRRSGAPLRQNTRKVPLLRPAAPHPGAVAGVPSGFAPSLERVAEEERGRDGRQRRHGGAEGPPAALRSAAPASKRAARSARQPRVLIAPSPQPASPGLPQAKRAPRLPTGCSRADCKPHGCNAPSVRLLPSPSTETRAPD